MKAIATSSALLENRLFFGLAATIAVASCFGLVSYDHPQLALSIGLPVGATVALLLRLLDRA